MIVIIVIGSVAKSFVHGNEFSEASARTNRISKRKRERERERERRAVEQTWPEGRVIIIQ